MTLTEHCSNGAMKRRKILYHLTPETDASPIYHEMVTQLAHGMEPWADVEVAAQGDTRQVLTCYDLVHVFGCWNKTAENVVTKAYREHVPTVFSPLGGLQPWNMKLHKSTLAVSAQRSMAAKALAVHVCGKLEQDTFVSLKWNSRHVLIKNPVLTSKVSFQEMAVQMEHLYQKVVDSHARLLLSGDACRAIGELLVAGVGDDILQDQKRTEWVCSVLNAMDEDEWRRICIYAYDEGILEVVERGLVRLQIEKDMVDVESVDRYPRELHYAKEPLESDKLLLRNPLTKSKLGDIIDTDETKERKILVEMLNLKHEMDRKRAPLSHLVDVYRSVRFMDADEDRLNEVAKEMGTLDFAERLMTVLQRVMGLTEGFMPFEAKDDQTALQMTNDITKFNTY